VPLQPARYARLSLPNTQQSKSESTQPHDSNLLPIFRVIKEHHFGCYHEEIKKSEPARPENASESNDQEMSSDDGKDDFIDSAQAVEDSHSVHLEHNFL